MKSADQLKHKNQHTDFDKKVLSSLDYLHPYVKHRLYVAECSGAVPKNLYNSTGIIDDAIIEVYEEHDETASAQDVKLKLFEKVDTHLGILILKEKEEHSGENSDDFLKGELQSLEVRYFVDADMDTVLFRDLEDISYSQNQVNRFDEVFEDEASNKEAVGCLNLHHDLVHSEGATLGKFYDWLPERVSNIIDLHMFGKLTSQEIAKLKGLDFEKVEKMLTSIPQKFRKHHLHN